MVTDLSAQDDHILFEWMDDADAAALNGRSQFRTSAPIPLLQPGDGITGEVVAVERSLHGYRNQYVDDDGLARVTIRVRSARSDGKPVPVGTWCSVWFAYADLRRAWQAAGGIRVGDNIRLGYLGKKPYRLGTKHGYACTVERGDSTPATKEGEARW